MFDTRQAYYNMNDNIILLLYNNIVHAYSRADSPNAHTTDKHGCVQIIFREKRARASVNNNNNDIHI